jgi:predicted metallo-beta-lactamase superfamily hydrolase
MIMGAPPRFDLPMTSCVNEEVKVVNTKLQKVAKMFKHGQVISLSEQRDHYTNHGLHMNATGKDWTANCLATKIKEIFVQRRTESAIMLKWKAENQVERNTKDEITEDTYDDPGQVKRSHKEQEGATMQRKSNSISTPNVSEVITIAVNGRSEDDSEDH